MKLRTKLVVSFFIVLLLPLLLSVVVIVGVRYSKNRGVKGAADQLYFFNTVDVLAENTDEDIKLLDEWARTFPENFLSTNYLNQMNDLLTKKNSYIVVKSGTKIVYDGAGNGMHPEYDELPNYGKIAYGDVLIIPLQHGSGLLKEVDFGDAHTTRGQAFVITPAGSVVPGAERILAIYFIWFAVILFVTGFIVACWLYRSIIKQVRLMQEGAENIRNGDLKTPIVVKGRDELSELAASMERMRKRLLGDAMQKLDNEEMQRKVLSNITHDLKTPLTSIIGYSEGILDGVAATPERQEKYVKTIHNKAENMNEMLNELSIFSKLDANTLPYHFKRINASEFFNACATETEEEMSGLGAGFTYENEIDDGTEVVADTAQIKRVLGNLTSNAVKYRMTDRNLLLTLRVKDAGDYVQVELEDNGRGISDEDLPHVFERLFRADKARNTDIGGSGLGLSIVKKIIDDHGGKVWVRSRLNEGSTFYFLLRKPENEVLHKKEEIG